jgi:hypothetical protein
VSIRRSSKEITSSQIHRRKDNWQRVLYAVRLAHFELMSTYLTDLFVFIPSILHQWLWVTFCLRDYLCYSSAMAFFRTSKQLKVSSEMVRSWFPTAIAHADLLHSVGEAVIRSHIAQTGLAWIITWIFSSPHKIFGRYVVLILDIPVPHRIWILDHLFLVILNIECTCTKECTQGCIVFRLSSAVYGVVPRFANGLTPHS